jgi:hypothetical protein
MGTSFGCVDDSSRRYGPTRVRQNALENESLLAHNVCGNNAAVLRTQNDAAEAAIKRFIFFSAEAAHQQ